MAMNRQAVKKTRILRVLVKLGVDRRKLVRQLSKVRYVSPNCMDLGGCFPFSNTPQGHGYWMAMAEKYQPELW